MPLPLPRFIFEPTCTQWNSAIGSGERARLQGESRINGQDQIRAVCNFEECCRLALWRDVDKRSRILTVMVRAKVVETGHSVDFRMVLILLRRNFACNARVLYR